jgi:spore coat protein JB
MERNRIPNGSRRELFCFINEISFAAYDALLFLDTHPFDQEALRYFQEKNDLRNQALKLYSDSYGPLTIATADDCSSNSWEWMMQPWPWEVEGGAC